MNCKTCCRVFVSILCTIAAILAIVLLSYGPSRANNLSLSQAKKDNITNILEAFISCSDRANDVTNRNDSTDHDYKQVLEHQCNSNQAYFYLMPAFTSAALFITTVAALISLNTASAKASLMWFCVFGGVTISLAVVAITITNSSTGDTMSRLVNCDGFSNATAQRILNLEAVCITGPASINGGGDNKTALTWLGSIILIYTGGALAIFCVVLLLITQPCSRSVNEEEEKDDYDPLRQPFQPPHHF